VGLAGTAGALLLAGGLAAEDPGGDAGAVEATFLGDGEGGAERRTALDGRGEGLLDTEGEGCGEGVALGDGGGLGEGLGLGVDVPGESTRVSGASSGPCSTSTVRTTTATASAARPASAHLRSITARTVPADGAGCVHPVHQRRFTRPDLSGAVVPADLHGAGADPRRRAR
jgi:hypothetical protein